MCACATGWCMWMHRLPCPSKANQPWTLQGKYCVIIYAAIMINVQFFLHAYWCDICYGVELVQAFLQLWYAYIYVMSYYITVIVLRMISRRVWQAQLCVVVSGVSWPSPFFYCVLACSPRVLGKTPVSVVFTFLHKIQPFFFSLVGCRRNYVISSNTAILPPENIAVLREFQVPASNVLALDSEQLPWCTSMSTTDIIGNYVNVTFSQPVLVEGMLSYGSASTANDTFFWNYKSSISLWYLKNENGPLIYHSVRHLWWFCIKEKYIKQLVFQILQNFTVTNVGYSDLVDSIAGLKFQFKINEIVVNPQNPSETPQFCLRLGILGCTQNDGTYTCAIVV